MKAEQVSELILVQSIEAVDEEGEILTFAERRQANAALEGETAGSLLEAESARASLLIGHVKRRAGWLWETTQSLSRLPWIFALICALFAVIAGAGVQGLGAGKTFHILSVPFLGLLAWNAISLGVLLLGPILWHRIRQNIGQKNESASDDRFSHQRETWRNRPYSSSWGQTILRVVLWLRWKWQLWIQPDAKDLVHQTSVRVLRVYWQEWLRQAGGLLRLQCARVLHLSMILFCVSMLGVAYMQGLTKAYSATRESTFLGATQIDFLLQVIFFPSQWILGPLPGIKANVLGVIGPAAPWIHHYTVTLAIFVILPRLVLWVGTWVKELWVSEHLPVSTDAVMQVPTLNVALASHTNVGKTSLARTLLRRDVGEVRDAEHVTRRRAGYFLIHTSDARLRLWDTPGFGNAKALTKNLRGNQGWSWLRALQDPALRFDREAALSLREEADVILYLIPAHGGTSVETMLRDEWDVLREIGCPVICVLNRLEGADAEKEEQLLREWQTFFAQEPLCREVMWLDAFARSLQEEKALFAAIERSVSPDKRELAIQLRQIWEEQSEQRQHAISSALAGILRQLSLDKEYEGNLGQEAAQRLQSRAQRLIMEAQNKILGLMELEGEVRDRMIQESELFLRSVMAKGNERTWGAVIGGAVSGLASGIMADVLAGGMTFFGGAAVGAILGALGGVGVAEGYRRVGKKGERTLEWSEDFLKGVALRMTVLYLAASSFGRARGEFTDDVILHPTPSASNKDSEISTEQRYQVLWLRAAEAALRVYWPRIWSVLNPQQTGLPPSDDPTKELENRCSTLFSEAAEQVKRLRRNL